MTLTADSVLDRINLKKSIALWKTLAIFAVIAIFLVLALNNAKPGLNISTDSIAKVSIEGLILEDENRDNILKGLKENSHVKAVIIYINSPGGTVVGGESIYNKFREISAVKPIVTVMGGLATSGGYMAAIGTDRIFAHAGTITGSVGVLLQSFDVTELGKKIGLEFVTFKSGKLKATPSPFEKINEESANAIKASIADSFDLFLNMVIERRNLTRKEIDIVSDGRIFTGRQALESKLVDAIGNQDDAIKWLQDEKKIDKNMKIIDVELDSEKKFIEKLTSKINDKIMPTASTKNGGLMAIWNM